MWWSTPLRSPVPRAYGISLVVRVLMAAGKLILPWITFAFWVPTFVVDRPVRFKVVVSVNATTGAVLTFRCHLLGFCILGLRRHSEVYRGKVSINHK